MKLGTLDFAGGTVVHISSGVSALIAAIVSVASAMIIGIVAGFACYWGVNALKLKFGYDDALDVFGVHGVGGTWGAIATGLFASKTINPSGADGLFHGNPGQLLNQGIAVLSCWLLASMGTFLILKIVNAVTPLRVSEEEEKMGIDLAFHGEVGYRYVHHEIGQVIESQKVRESPFGSIPLVMESKASGD